MNRCYPRHAFVTQGFPSPCVPPACPFHVPLSAQSCSFLASLQSWRIAAPKGEAVTWKSVPVSVVVTPSSPEVLQRRRREGGRRAV